MTWDQAWRTRLSHDKGNPECLHQRLGQDTRTRTMQGAGPVSGGPRCLAWVCKGKAGWGVVGRGGHRGNEDAHPFGGKVDSK